MRVNNASDWRSHANSSFLPRKSFKVQKATRVIYTYVPLSLFFCVSAYYGRPRSFASIGKKSRDVDMYIYNIYNIY